MTGHWRVGTFTHDVIILHELHILQEVSDERGTLLSRQGGLLDTNDRVQPFLRVLHFWESPKQSQAMCDGVCRANVMRKNGMKLQRDTPSFKIRSNLKSLKESIFFAVIIFGQGRGSR